MLLYTIFYVLEFNFFRFFSRFILRNKIAVTANQFFKKLAESTGLYNLIHIGMTHFETNLFFILSELEILKYEMFENLKLQYKTVERNRCNALSLIGPDDHRRTLDGHRGSWSYPGTIISL